MRVFRHFENLPSEIRGAAVAVGNFDGVHRGHHEVISEAGRIAGAAAIPWAVLTLEPHPKSIFDPGTPPFRLTPYPAKVRLIGEIGPMALVVIPFDSEFARTAPRAFVERVLVHGLGARHVVCGHDFAFGHGRKGTPELLLWMGDEFDFGFTCVPEIKDDDGEPFSSTRIREYLRMGRPDVAAHLLGRPFAIEGEVVSGDQRGRTLGFPTANIKLGEYVRPAHGVYAVRACFTDETGTLAWPAVANLGLRPTFGGHEPLLEAHLFDFAGDLYGRTLRVELIAFLREEKKFDGLELLRAQIAEDCTRARRTLGAEDGPAVLRAARS
ncbi:MAG: bifunctional riboflavin kinase/FAD synthetase [Rhodospirillales bacterium]|nr:bifunctional riboflavin kinase/FAD synthetase [Rhodospirillales bacterium]